MNNLTAIYLTTTWTGRIMVGPFVIGSLGIAANLMLLYAHMKDPVKVLKCSSSPFIINIAIIDLFTSLTFFLQCIITGPFENFNEFWFSNITTAIFNSIYSFFQTTLSNLLLIFSIARFTSVAFPLWHRVKFTARLCRFLLTGAWLFDATFEGVTNFLTHFYRYKFSTTLSRLIFMSLMLFLTQVFYVASYFSVKKQRKNLGNVQDISKSSAKAIRARLRNENSFLTTIAIISSISAIVFIPHLLMGHILLVTLYDRDGAAKLLWDVFIFWQMIILPINFVVNGPIYVWRMKKYRKTFKKLYLCR
jgi:hypothetical protein